jgi:hypothetical protein
VTVHSINARAFAGTPDRAPLEPGKWRSRSDWKSVYGRRRRTQIKCTVTVSQQAISIGHDVKLSKARRLRFVHNLPLQGKSAHILNFRTRPEQGSNRTEPVESSRLCRVVWMFDPAGIGLAPREHRQFPVRPNFSKHRMNEENVMRRRRMRRGRCSMHRDTAVAVRQPAQTKGEKSWIPFHAARCWQ